jgi:hypothetical protein
MENDEAVILENGLLLNEKWPGTVIRPLVIPILNYQRSFTLDPELQQLKKDNEDKTGETYNSCLLQFIP